MSSFTKLELAAAAGTALAALYFIATPRQLPPMQLPATMKAVLAVDNKCVTKDVPVPQPSAGQLIIKVVATAINRLDTLQRAGKSPVPKGVTEVLGLEVAGVVAATNNSGTFRVGDEVLALVPGGGYAEYVTVDAATVMRKPATLSWAQAASVPEAWLTAFLNLRLGSVAAGETVLIHAAASGVGVASIQLAKAMGANVIVTVGSKEKLALCTRLGALGGAVRHDGPWVEAARTLAPSGKVDVVLDCVAGGYAEQNVDILGVDGRWVLYSLLSGGAVPPALASTFLAQLMKKRLQLLPTTLRTRSVAYKRTLVDAFATRWLPLIGGQLEHVIDREFEGLESAQAAHEYMESNANSGKVVLLVGGAP